MTASTDKTVALLASSELFGALDASSLQTIASQLGHVRLGGRHTLMRSGEHGDTVYLVVVGRLRSYVVTADGGEQAVGEVGRGETVGEMALLTDQPRSATVRAIRDTHLLAFSRAACEFVVQRHPEILLQITRIVVLRLQRALQGETRPAVPATIAVLPAGRESPYAEVASLFAEALGAHGPTRLLDSHVVDHELGEGAAQSGSHDSGTDALVAWLGDQEAAHRFVVYRADPTPSPWSSLCVRHADRVLLVGAADSPPALNEVERRLLAPGPDWISPVTDLILVHPVSTHEPLGTRAWLAPRWVNNHHHVRRDDPSAYARVARFVVGRAIALVLGGGGARGFAHIGVIRALRERGVPVDIVGGTSIGGGMAALFAMGLDPDQMLQITTRELSERTMVPFTELTLPIVSLFSVRSPARAVRNMLGDRRIEDLWVKFFCTSTNISRAEAVVHERGLLRRWVLAGAMIPGIGPPVFHDGELFIDGGLLDNLPVQAARSLGGDVIIAVDVSTDVDLSTDLAASGGLSGWRALWQRSRPFGRRHRIPGIREILLRTVTLSSTHQRGALRGESLFYVQPPLECFRISDVKHIHAIVDAGYRYASERLDAWQADPRWLEAFSPRGSVPEPRGRKGAAS